MDKKALFSEALTSLVEFAAANNNQLTMEDVNLYFKDLIDDDSQYQFIYDYLAINKIKVEGAVVSPVEELVSEEVTEEIVQPVVESEEELAFIKMYMNELDALPSIDSDEKALLVQNLVDGNLDAVNKLVESELKHVADIATNYKNQGVTFGDLIQEGNMGVMLGLSEYNSDCGDFDKYITAVITKAIESIINEQVSSSRVSQHLADKLNQLDNVTKELSEKLGRVPEIKELSEAMGIDEEETQLLLKTSLDTLSVNEDSKIADETIDNKPEATPTSDPLEWRVNKK